MSAATMVMIIILLIVLVGSLVFVSMMAQRLTRQPATMTTAFDERTFEGQVNISRYQVGESVRVYVLAVLKSAALIEPPPTNDFTRPFLTVTVWMRVNLLKDQGRMS